MKEEIYEYLWAHNKPAQHRDEFPILIKEVEKLNPKIIIEIGIDRGGTLQYWWEILKDDPDAILIAIDPVLTPTYLENFKNMPYNYHVINGRSGSLSTLIKVKEILGDRKVDFLLIDGDHNIAHIDYANYNEFVRDDGLICFHDWGSRRVGPPTERLIEEWDRIYYISMALVWKRKTGLYEILYIPDWMTKRTYKIEVLDELEVVLIKGDKNENISIRT